MSTFGSLIADLTHEYQRADPPDALQFCATWFNKRLEEQRTRTRNILAQRASRDVPTDLYIDTHSRPGSGPAPISPFSQPVPHRPSVARKSVSPSPFGTLNVPGNALLPDNTVPPPPVFNFNGNDIPPTSPLNTSNPNPFAGFTPGYSPGISGSGSLDVPNPAVFARRTSVSAESIALDDMDDEPLPVYPKTPEQIRRIESSIADNFLFKQLDEQQRKGALGAMQERKTQKGEIIIRQGDDGDYFYLVESGHLNCYIRSGPLPPSWFEENQPTSILSSVGSGDHSVLGKKVTECKQGSKFGELALMHGHPRAASVVSMEPSTLWTVDRITFRKIILREAHKRITMYEYFLSTVDLLSSLSAQERSKIADALTSRVYMDGEDVVREGDMGDTFFFVEEGEASVTKKQTGDGGEVRQIKVGHYKKGDYFGELSLLHLAPRAATVSAVKRESPDQPKLKVAALDHASFTRLLGPLREIMERKAGEQYGPVHAPRMSFSR